MNTRLLSIHYFCSLAALGSFTAYVVLYYKDLGFSAWQVGVVMSAFTVMRMLCPNFFGWLADKTGKKAFWIRFASGCSTLCFGFLLYAKSFYAVLAATVLVGFFWSAVAPLTEALTFASLTKTPERYSYIRVWGSIGFVLAVWSVGRILEMMPVSSLLWLVQALMVVATCVTFALKEAPDAPVYTEHSHPSVYGLISQPHVLGLLAAGFCMSAAHAAVNTFLTMHLANHHYSTHMIGWMWTIGVGVEIVFFYFPHFFYQFNPKNVLLSCFAIGVMRFMLLGWMVDFFPTLILAQTFHGVTYGIHHIVTVAAVHRYFAGVYQSQGQTIYSGLCVCGGLMVGQLMTGYAMDHFGGQWAFTGSAVLSGLGLLIILLTMPSQLEKKGSRSEVLEETRLQVDEGAVQA